MIKNSTRPERRRQSLRPHHNFINRADILVRGSFGELIARLPGRPVAGRSKYMPHIGAKQRAKGGAA